MNSCPNELLEEIKNHSLESYYNNHLAERSKFFKKLTNDEIMSYTPVIILTHTFILFNSLGTY